MISTSIRIMHETGPHTFMTVSSIQEFSARVSRDNYQNKCKSCAPSNLAGDAAKFIHNSIDRST